MTCKKRIILAVFAVFIFVFNISPAQAVRQNVTDWYIQDFQTEIVVNKDSSLDITEKITADCGFASDKHGIFRIVPESVNIEGMGKMKTPVELLAITDFFGNPLQYTESRNSSDQTITWKIGDPNRTVIGVNQYQIHYRVKNAIRFLNPDFDELYWNLNGNFWDLETDHFLARIVFPSEVTQNNAKVEYYTGPLGSKNHDLARFSWSAPNVLEFESTKTLRAREGITMSVIFPKNIFMPYVPGFWELYGKYFFFLIPLLTFGVCFYLWKKYGDDPEVDKTVIAEYDIPGNLSPLELGMLATNGKFKNEFVTAEIINLAVKGFLEIKETHKKVLFFDSKDYELIRKSDDKARSSLSSAQEKILGKIFANGKEIKLSSLKNKFYTAIKDIKEESENALENKKLIVKSGLTVQRAMRWVAYLIFVSLFMFGEKLWEISIVSIVSIGISAVILILFSFIMPKRTQEGAELNWKIKGFKLFMETVDKDRAAFYEKENIFEKFLPYAIVFDITSLWIKRMKEIYGEAYFSAYHPVWYTGSLSVFDADNFSSAMESLSSAIAASTSAPSGSGGAGSSGGGGGGGGGGGW